jgi:hypothetical protein
MYNFRYHLITIVSIFAALALGLLLGAAIGNSDLARNTSTDMVDALMARFDEVDGENRELQAQLASDGVFTAQLVSQWQLERLDGRTVCVVAVNTPEGQSRAQALREVLVRAGAATVVVTIASDALVAGSDSMASFKKVVPERAGESYINTVSRKLAEEWSYSYSLSSADVPVAADAEPQPLSSVATGSEAPTAFQRTLSGKYPLTRELLSAEVITIAVDYTSLIEQTSPRLPDEHLAALGVMTAWGLPYGTNGLVAVMGETDADSLSAGLAQVFAALGADKRLPYPGVMRPTSGSAAAEQQELDFESVNYFALLVQASADTQPQLTLAAEYGLSYLLSLDGATDEYNLVALLTGGTKGSYGSAASPAAPDGRFVPVPQDPTGRLAFATW